jgi:hypothetical protein
MAKAIVAVDYFLHKMVIYAYRRYPGDGEKIYSDMDLFEKKQPYISQNEDFLRLVQVIKEEPQIRQTLKSILGLDNFNRKSALNTWLEELKLKQAPKKFRSALSCLLDDDIAQKTLDIIREQ